MVCAEVKGKFAGEVKGGVGRGSKFEGEAFPISWRKQAGFKEAKHRVRKLYDA